MPLLPTQQFCSSGFHQSNLNENLKFENEILKVKINCFQILAWQAAIDTRGLTDLSQVTTVVAACNFLFDYLEKVLDAEKVSLKFLRKIFQSSKFQFSKFQFYFHY